MDDSLRRILRAVALGLPLGAAGLGVALSPALLACSCPDVPPSRLVRMASWTETSGDDASAEADGGVELTCEAICMREHHATPDECSLSTPTTAECVYIDPGGARGCVSGRLPSRAPRRFARAGGAHVERWLLHTATLEAAAVPAFRELARALERHGAPRALVTRARRAAADEVRHARTMVALAAAHSGHAAVRVRCVEAPATSLAQLALLNASEGCVREAYGALLAAHQAERAQDPALRTAMRVIARDEARHALLSLDIDAWARRSLDARTQARLDAARAEALAELRHVTSAAQQDDALGLPDAATSHALLQRVA